MPIDNFSPMHSDANIRAGSYDKGTNSIEAVWTTGAPVTRRGRDGYYEEILSLAPGAVRLDRLNAGAPLLDTHHDGDLSHVLGNVIPGSARIIGGKGLARIALSNAPADADNVAKIRDGIVRNVSVGYMIHRVEIAEREGETPIYSVVDWEPMELSAVPVPADTGAQFRMAARSLSGAHAPEMVVLDYWSPKACRLRMYAAQRRVGMFENREFSA